METVNTCNLCGGVRWRVAETYHRYGQVFTMVECLDCGLAFLNPRPAPSEMAAYYGEAYAQVHHHLHREPRFLAALFFRVCRAWLRARYAGRGGGLTRWLFWPLELLWCRTVHSYALYGLTQVGRVLDVGCGNGDWLGRMRLYGFECYGCEPDAVRAKIAASILGVQVSVNDLPGAQYPEAHFDVVRLWHVLEHVHDPMAVLVEARRVLRLGGLLILSSPNRDSILARVYANVEDVPRHLFVFSPGTIRLYLEKTGFSIHHLRTEGLPWDIYGYFYEASRSFLREKERADLEPLNERFWKSRRRRFEYRATQKFFDQIGAGDSFCLSAVKV